MPPSRRIWKLDYSAPQRRAGEAMLLIDSVDPLKDPRKTWIYVPGQRRVRQVELPDEAPHHSSSGTYTNDDAFVYTGVLERYDLKLLGKREMIIPYNTYRLTYHDNVDDVLRPRHLNPELLRVVFALPTYDYHAGVPFAVNHVGYNLDTGAYFFAFFPGAYTEVHYGEPMPERLWSPDSMAGTGVR